MGTSPAVGDERFRADLDVLRDIILWRSVPWLEMSACRQQEADRRWWFIAGNTSRAKWQKNKAKRICTECPVRWQCLAEYIDEPFGIFGGYDEKERRHFRETTHYTKWHNILALQKRFRGVA